MSRGYIVVAAAAFTLATAIGLTLGASVAYDQLTQRANADQRPIEARPPAYNG